MPPGSKRKRSSAHSSKSSKSSKPAAFSRSGRPLKKPKHDHDSSFVDSALALSDISSDDEVLIDGEAVVVKGRRRALSRTPEPYRRTLEQTEVPYETDPENEYSDDEHERSIVSPKHTASAEPLQIVLKVPAGASRDITLNVDLSSLAAEVVGTPLTTLQKKSKIKATTQKKKTSTTAKPSEDVIKNAGLLGRLPPEIREDILLDVFQAERYLDLSAPGEHFSRSAALLRSCRLLYEEGRQILYGRNQFYIDRSFKTYGSLWATQKWHYLDYDIARTFMKQIGNHNIALLRDVRIVAQDYSIGGHRELTADQRKAVNNEPLMSIMRDLARYSDLRSLRIDLATKSHVSKNDFRFVDIMTRIKTDHLQLNDFAHSNQWYRTAHGHHGRLPPHARTFIEWCTTKMVRKDKLHPATVDDWAANGDYDPL